MRHEFGWWPRQESNLRHAVYSTWSGMLDDVRTLILEKGLDIGGFERALRTMDGVMPQLAEAA